MQIRTYVKQVIGPVVDVEFSKRAILGGFNCFKSQKTENLVLEVAQPFRRRACAGQWLCQRQKV